MHATRHDLPLDSRRPLTELLNARLADLIDLHSHAKQAHWNVKGANFIALHELFDKVATAADEAVDEVAERVVVLGGTALGTLAAVVKATQLPAYPTNISAADAHVNSLAISLAATAKAVRAAVDTSAKLGDTGTSDLFTGISRELDKLLWMVEAHAQT